MFYTQRLEFTLKNLKTLLALISVLSTNALANVTINQPDKVLGFTGYDGKNIQLQFEFQKPIESGESVDLLIGNRRVLVIKNETSNKLERFTTRFRFNRDEVLTIKTSGKNPTSTNYTPTVSSDFALPTKDSFNTQARASVVSEQLAKSYNSKTGDCIYLMTGISNSGSEVPKSFNIKINGGSVFVESSDRISTSPFFIVGLNETAKSCEISVQ